ncbi:putative ras modification protein erf4 [Golovinomyces cichoracearum]|uniref:Ras modification protein ERF4 n=1 Tax=Golovinomyces cichoracearum TaxID=62708 RepID=A0A420HBU6_9PEZI|nr:putative ras modification protein erf4 [Golovinomyces cichoracearum]
MTKTSPSISSPSCQAITSSVVTPASTAQATRLPSNTTQSSPFFKSSTPHLTRRESEQHSGRSIGSTQWNARRALSSIRSISSKGNRETSASWIKGRADRRQQVNLWKPVNSTRHLTSKESILTNSDASWQHPNSSNSVKSADGNSIILTTFETKSSQKTGNFFPSHSLELESYSKDSRATPHPLLAIGKQSNQKIFFPEPERSNMVAICGGENRGRNSSNTAVSSISHRTNTQEINNSGMLDLEHGSNRRYPEDGNAIPVLQYANRNNTSSHTGLGSVPSPMLSDTSSILGYELQDTSREEWGPQHPCFPHLNPHVPLSSPLFRSTRIIRIQRDWMLEGDLAPTFSNLYPQILETSGVSEQEFRQLLDNLNHQLILAFNPMSLPNILDGIISTLTGWLWEDAGLTSVKGNLHRVEKMLEDWNRKMEEKVKDRFEKDSIPRALPLRRTGYMSLDIQVLNPEISRSRE